MVFDVNQVTGIGEFELEQRGDDRIYIVPGKKAFLVERFGGNKELKTIEIRTDENLSKVLKDEYESVMDSRYFGHGGIEIVLSGQIELEEIYDLVRLSYNMTAE